jgi:alpha-glucosidase (family GH31 glycosyl hydrolase)
MVRKGVFRRLSSLVQRRATVVRDTVRIEASQLCHAAAAGWRTDPRVRDIGDEFMFGPSILVAPALQGDAGHRTLYLPGSLAWYDFWTGQAHKGDREIEADAPLDRIPLFVRAGSILPLGSEIEYANEEPAGPIELRIYPGADSAFALYEDAGDSYDYEKGVHSLIPCIGPRQTALSRLETEKDNIPEYRQAFR